MSLVPATGAPASASVTARRMLGEGRTHELLLNGFSAALRFRLELWRSENFFDKLDSAITWAVFVRFDPYTKTYQIVQQRARDTEVSAAFPDRASVEEALERATLVSLPPKRRGEVHYYNVVVDVATLEFSDLDELQKWLRGDVEPAARGRVNPVSALRRGIGSLISRMLGGERRHYEARSVTFRS